MHPVVVVIAVVGLLMLLRPATADPVANLPAGWTTARLSRASIVFSVCASRGFGSNVAMALVANAYGETRIGDYDGGDAGNSWGIYQLNRAVGLGRGLTIEQCQDVEIATGVMLDECERLGMDDDASAAELTEWICIYVERPASSATRAAERVGYLVELYGEDA